MKLMAVEAREGASRRAELERIKAWEGRPFGRRPRPGLRAWLLGLLRRTPA